MNLQPDQFFREKLQSFHLPPTPGAWDRISDRLNHKRNRTVWLRAAAAVLLLMVSAIVLLRTYTRPETPQTIAQQTGEKPIVPDNVNKTPETNAATTLPPQAPVEAKGEQPVTIEKKSVKVKKEAETQPASPLKVDTEKPSSVPQPAISEQAVAVQAIDLLPETTEFTSVVKPEEERSVILVYSAAEVNEKYLDKKALAEATPEKKKASTLRKLLNKAYHLKNNQDPLGGLRQKKDEILALGFINDRQRNQKR